MKLKLNIEKKTIIFLTIISIVTIGIVGGVILPTLYNIKNLEDETSKIRQYMEKKYQDTRSLSNSKQKIEEIQTMMADFEEHLFYRGDELQLITMLENLATANKVNQKINQSNLDKTGDGTITFSITVNGDYINVLQYLNTLEKQKYFINIKQLTFSSAFTPQNKNPNAAVMNLELLLYANKR